MRRIESSPESGQLNGIESEKAETAAPLGEPAQRQRSSYILR